jgi:NAD(P)-dependent dehydrogenase (short-subunit alcohol dehydrogenase family)
VAWRFKDENIRCNAVSPGGVATGIISSVNTADFDLEALKTMRPIHEAHYRHMSTSLLIQPDEVVQMLLSLVSDLSNKISGATILVDTDWSTI